MSEDEALDNWISALSALHGLTLDDEAVAQVRANLAVAKRLASLLAGFSLDDREEPLPVYRP